jgi:hypothetical protein
MCELEDYLLIMLVSSIISGIKMHFWHRAAAVMSLIQSAKLNRHAPHAYLKDVLTRLPTHMNSHCCRTVGHRLSVYVSTTFKWTRICYCSGPVKFKQHIEPDGPGSSQ